MLQQFDRNHNTRRRDEYRRECFYRLYRFDINHNTGQRDEYWK